jgi:transposase
MAGWATAPMQRQQLVLFSTMLDDVIGQDHPVRLFDEILAVMDWSGWEGHYVLVAGQPPIHPKVMAAAILYGLSVGLRSSRQLERACLTSLDFLWLVEKRDIDHSTFCKFRTQFGPELKELFGQVGRVALNLGLVRLNQVSLDGTKVAANNGRHATAPAATLAQKLQELDRQVGQLLAEAQAADAREGQLFGDSSPHRLPAALADVQRRQARLQKALAAAEAKDAAAGPAVKPAAVPVTDPDSAIGAHKHGGFGPNYTPMATVDGTQGFLVDVDVLDDGDETQAVLPAVARIEETFGHQPAQLLADGAFGNGENLAGLAQAQVEGYIPLEQREDRPDNPARRADVSAAVAPADWAKLPINGRTKLLSRAAFVYEPAQDRYWCPQGQCLAYAGTGRRERPGGWVECREYRCAQCGPCPRRSKCVRQDSPGREIRRDEYEPLREAMDRRLRTPEGQAVYRRRKWMAEYPFGILKSVLGLRQFLLRGLEKVRTEWCWAGTAFNLKKLARAVARIHGQVTALPA